MSRQTIHKEPDYSVWSLVRLATALTLEYYQHIGNRGIPSGADSFHCSAQV